MAIKYDQDQMNAKPWNCSPTADDIEKIIDYILMDPFYRYPSKDNRSPQAQIQCLSIRLPDATVVTDSDLKEVDRRYREAGWWKVEREYGNTLETEYQTRILLYYEIKKPQ